ncbi:MAG TPA: hypothetical protein VKU01_16955 [Bryobacteraceae bacterium]|nr:hypothetical protein [Bryobacteraceae bacterium]
MRKPIVKPIIDEITKKVPPPQTVQVPTKAAELDQDAGGGYNSNRTYPQT